MAESYPEFELFTNILAIRTQIEELGPLTPSATPRQRSFREYLETLSATLPVSIPGPDDPMIASIGVRPLSLMVMTKTTKLW